MKPALNNTIPNLDEVIKQRDQFWADVMLCSPVVLTKLKEILFESTIRNNGYLLVDMRTRSLNNVRLIDDQGDSGMGRRLFQINQPERVYRILNFLSHNKERLKKFNKVFIRLTHNNNQGVLTLKFRKTTRPLILKIIYLASPNSPQYQKFKAVFDYEKINPASFDDEFYARTAFLFDTEFQLTDEAREFIRFLLDLLTAGDESGDLEKVPSYFDFFNLVAQLFADEQ